MVRLGSAYHERTIRYRQGVASSTVAAVSAVRRCLVLAGHLVSHQITSEAG
jgi:hypothetical protein